MDLTQLLAFCVETQPDAYEGLQLGTISPRRRKSLARPQSEVGKRGITNVLRKGIKDGPYHIELYGTPSPGNALAVDSRPTCYFLGHSLKRPDRLHQVTEQVLHKPQSGSQAGSSRHRVEG